MPFLGIGWGIIDILTNKICMIINCLYSQQEKLTTKVLSVMNKFWAFAKRPEPESRIW